VLTTILVGNSDSAATQPIIIDLLVVVGTYGPRPGAARPHLMRRAGEIRAAGARGVGARRTVPPNKVHRQI